MAARPMWIQRTIDWEFVNVVLKFVKIREFQECFKCIQSNSQSMQRAIKLGLHVRPLRRIVHLRIRVRPLNSRSRDDHQFMLELEGCRHIPASGVWTFPGKPTAENIRIHLALCRRAAYTVPQYREVRVLIISCTAADSFGQPNLDTILSRRSKYIRKVVSTSL
jgi:hypothetical protein